MRLFYVIADLLHSIFGDTKQLHPIRTPKLVEMKNFLEAVQEKVDRMSMF